MTANAIVEQLYELFPDQTSDSLVARIRMLVNDNKENPNLYKGWMIGEPFFSDNCWKIHASKGDDHIYTNGENKETVQIRIRANIDEWERNKILKEPQPPAEELKKEWKELWKDIVDSMSKREIILQNAIQCVTKDRNATHGDPEDNFKTIADYWNLYLKARVKRHDYSGFLDKMDVSVMMILMKVSRIARSPEHMDHWIDICGYAACGGEIACKKKDPAHEMELPK